MVSFKKGQEILLLCLEEEIIDKEEFILLYEEYTLQNSSIPHTAYENFSLVNNDPAECKVYFRVEKADIPLLVEALRVPPIFKCYKGIICDGTENLCIELKRFAYPCRYWYMISMFGRSVAEHCMISDESWIGFTTLMGTDRVTQKNQAIMDPAFLSTYANAIHNTGAALDNCFGFIDGTVRPIFRPNCLQANCFHALTFQSVTLPNRLIGQLYGPVGENLRVLIIK